MLEDLHERLSGVVIECLDFEDFITRYDSKGALFYLDPPYWGCEGDYGKELFEQADFERLARVLAPLKGQFILSLNDVQQVRNVFADFRFLKVETTYTISAKKTGGKRAGEVLISNFPLSV